MKLTRPFVGARSSAARDYVQEEVRPVNPVERLARAGIGTGPDTKCILGVLDKNPI